jgi:glycerophosphoryl diester phosphodiesterase
VIIDFPTPMVFGHRGASTGAPENTLAAFQLALQKGAQGIEFDVKLTADGEVVVLHDQTLDRTTDASGDLRSYTLQQLSSINAGSWFNREFSGEQIPTLRSVLEIFSEHLLLNIELTNYASPSDPLPEKVAGIVNEFDLRGRILFSSFNPGVLRRLKNILPVYPIALLTLPGLPGALSGKIYPLFTRFDALHPHYSTVTRKMVCDFHEANKRVHTWTVNKPADISRLLSLGVDGIITDDPTLALTIMAGKA